MIHISNKEDCCGCGACAQACPKNCIVMSSDDEGFYYPSVLTEHCIQCGKCEKVCPQISYIHDYAKQPINVYVSKAIEEDLRLNSSSGGIFGVLARTVINSGGVVVGVAFDSEMLVHHICIRTTDELYKLQGSKYLQSRIEDTYKEVEAYLRNNIPVLFSGTACQVAGLKQYLGREYDQLITIDVLCHGVPSPLVWKKYINEKQKLSGSKAKTVHFRDKSTGWKNYSVRVDFQSDTYISKYTDNAYMKLFLSNMCLRPSCHKCVFKGMDRPSNITLGDCWGVGSHSPEMDDDLGTSVVIIHDLKGKKLFDSIADHVHNKPQSLDIALPPNSDARKSVTPHFGRTAFFKLIKYVSVEHASKYLNPQGLDRLTWKLARLIWK